MAVPPNRTRVLAISASLFAVTLLAYARVAGNGFTTFDDHDYVTDNPHVKAGLSREGVAWAFTTGRTANWHPLTWLSHMLDYQVFGSHAAGHHLVSLAMHVTTTLLLFHLFRRMTGATWASAFVASAFALHPLHVESVAWVSERKDVLCALFWILALLAYVRYVERPGAARYALVVVLHALGLLAKPMIVTFPFTLLLLDLWPLRRIDLSPGSRPTFLSLVREKIPFLALAVASSVTTYIVQLVGGAMHRGNSTPFHLRLENAIVSYAAYLGKSIWPSDLAAYYPHPFAAYPTWRIAGAALLLAILIAGSLLAARVRPWLTVGCLWFLGTLVPVIGLVQVGSQAMADRYTYIPMIGLSVAVAWSGVELTHRFARSRIPLAALFVLTTASWTAWTWRQVGFWRDDTTLYSIAKKKLQDKFEVHGSLGNLLLKQGRVEEAIPELRRAVELAPSFAQGHNDLGIALEEVGRSEEAIAEYREALRCAPDFAEAHHNLAGALAEKGRLDEAIEHYQRALEIRPDQADTHCDLGITLLQRGRIEEGILHLRRAIELDPRHEKARSALAERGL